MIYIHIYIYYIYIYTYIYIYHIIYIYIYIYIYLYISLTKGSEATGLCSIYKRKGPHVIKNLRSTERFLLFEIGIKHYLCFILFNKNPIHHFQNHPECLITHNTTSKHLFLLNLKLEDLSFTLI